MAIHKTSADRVKVWVEQAILNLNKARLLIVSHGLDADPTAKQELAGRDEVGGGDQGGLAVVQGSAGLEVEVYDDQKLEHGGSMSLMAAGPICWPM